MRIQSPLSNLCDILNQVKSSAIQYQATLRKNEAATRAVLIDPVLRAVGWDTANTYMVEVEKTLGQTRVDYALYDHNGDVRVIIEAKPLGENLANQTILMNLVTYAFTYGLQDIFLTDGLLWQHFIDFQPGKVVPAKILNLAEDNFVECAAYLVHRLDAAKFWPETQTMDALAQQVTRLESVVSAMQKEIAFLKSPNAPSTNREVEAVRKLAQVSSSISTSHSFIALDEAPNLTKAKPTAMRLPDGSEIAVRKWKDVLCEACRFAFLNTTSIPLPLPDRSRRKVNLLSIVKPPPGISFDEEVYNNQTVYIYTNYDANNCVANAGYILSHVPKEKLKVAAGVALRLSP